MSWKLLNTDEKILVVSLFIVVASFGLTFSTEINSRFQPGITGQLIEPCGDGFCSADEYASQSCPLDCPVPPPTPPGSTGTCDCLDDNVLAQAQTDYEYQQLVLAQCGATVLPPPCSTYSSPPPASCGDAACVPPEDSTNCPIDCGTASSSPPPSLPSGCCGDPICESWEQGICLSDCSYSPPPTTACGNAICETGEDTVICPADCSSPPPSGTCGNNVCDAGETALSCTVDCTDPPGCYIPPVTLEACTAGMSTVCPNNCAMLAGGPDGTGDTV